MRAADYSNLHEYCLTDSERYAIALLEEGYSLRQVAEKLKRNQRTIERAVQRVRSRSQNSGVDASSVEPYGYSTLKKIDEETGHPKTIMYWEKSNVARELFEERIKAFVDSMEERIQKLPQRPKLATPKVSEESLSLYVYGDPHFGLKSWGAEVGENWDLEQAKEDFRLATTLAVSRAPASAEAILYSPGDLIHADDETARTPRSKHQLDVDGRHEKVMSVAEESLIGSVDQLLERHRRVTVILLRGNHDPHAGPAIRRLMAAWYRREPRVTVRQDVADYQSYRYGEVLLGFAHGHGKKMSEMGETMLAHWPEDTGQCKHRYWWTGHIHHQRVIELATCIVESSNSLCGRTTYEALRSLHAVRCMRRITYHPTLGEVDRHRVTVEAARMHAA